VIRRVTIRRFKRFDDVTFELPGHVVVAGPNNTGKTTLLQAIAAFDLALARWRELNDFQKRKGAYTRAPIARQAFSAVPLRTFDLLWSERRYDGAPIEVELWRDGGQRLCMEFLPNTTEQIFVRPHKDSDPEITRQFEVGSVFVPAMSGLSTDEHVLRPPAIEQILFQAKPGDVLRNLLMQASESSQSWALLSKSIQELFGFELHPPDGRGAFILAEFTARTGGPRLDIASAGSGFQQVLMLLTFLYTRPGTLLLLDEPDAHLHVILQDAIYGELRRVAVLQHSQLLIATHSEVLINAVEPRELIVLVDQPRMVADSDERNRLIQSLGVLSHDDIVRAMTAPGVLYLEDYTDLEILRAFARVLGHPALPLLTKAYWRRTVHQHRFGARGIQSKEHYEALELVRPDLPGLEILDGDARPEIPATEITGHGLQRARWRRYEIESYLIHPAALERFVEVTVGARAAGPHVNALREHLAQTLPPAILKDPLGDHAFLTGVKARTLLLPPALQAAGLPGFAYQRYFEIASVMQPAEIHPEVVEKLDAIVKAFRS
jgi:predicted ATPase